MSSSPKIFVFKMREIIYTFLLLFLAVLLVICLFLMFRPKAEEDGASADNTASGSEPAVETAVYTPGVYTSSVTLGSSTADVEVAVDKNRIRSIRLVNLSETAAVSFPLVSPALDNIAAQILQTQKLEGITCPQENRYTSQLLLSAVADALALARTQAG